MKAGIWIDQRKAVIVLLNGQEEELFEIKSNVNELHTKGGYGGARKDMPQDARSDKKVLARRLKETKVFFDSIAKKLPKLERLLVFGPGEGKKLFASALKEKSKFADTRIRTQSSDQLTRNQIHAHVQDFFAVKNTKAPKATSTSASEDTLRVKHEFVKMAVSDATEILVNEKLETLKKRYTFIIRANVFYKKEKDPNARNFVCEMILSIPGENLFAASRATELSLAIAETFSDLERQLKKWKSKRS